MNKIFQDELNQQPVLSILKSIPFILFWFSSCPLRVPSWAEFLFLEFHSQLWWIAVGGIIWPRPQKSNFQCAGPHGCGKTALH
ncbi:MAG: hypothetical protein ACKVZH_13760 [Blastocatellia bacterium]